MALYFNFPVGNPVIHVRDACKNTYGLPDEMFDPKESFYHSVLVSDVIISSCFASVERASSPALPPLRRKVCIPEKES